jgi:15-cis-phytoene synthase
MSAGNDHCRDLVRSQDKDRFLAVLFAPEAAQPHLFALHAFDLEVRRIRQVVSEPQIGLIRQQWWSDTIDGIYSGSVPGHPVAEALAAAIVAGNLPKSALQALVIAHEFDLFADAMPDVTALEAYLGETSSTLIQLAAMILDATSAPAAAEAAGLAGVAHGLALILADPSRRRQYLPPGMDVAAAIAHARKRLAEARVLRPKLNSTVLPAFLPASLTELYLRRIAAAPDRPLVVTQFRRQLTLWYYARRDGF